MTLAEAFVSKRNNFTLVRLLAALAVVVSHSFYISTGLTDSEPLISSTGLSLGGHAVNVFFGISGFLILASWERHPDALRFALARLFRIMPALMVAACVMVLAGMWLTQMPVMAYLASSELEFFLLKTMTFNARATLPGVFQHQEPTDTVFMTIWTLKYEVFAYLGVLLAGLTGAIRYRLFYPAVLLLCAAAITALALSPQIATAHVSLPHFARFGSCFALGMCAWHFRRVIPVTSGWMAVSATVMLAAVATGKLHLALLYPAEIYAALWLALSPRLPVSPGFGDIDLSYGIYLYGWPISQIVQGIWPNIGIVGLSCSSMILASGVAWCSWLAVERPALRALPVALGWRRGRAPRPPALSSKSAV
jgi:peptidoglycan/LPS O-acetylase OafA/YrhL